MLINCAYKCSRVTCITVVKSYARGGLQKPAMLIVHTHNLLLPHTGNIMYSANSLYMTDVEHHACDVYASDGG